MPLFMQIVNAGVLVVTLTNQETYSRDRLRKEPYAIYGVISELIRANQESFYKGQRVADAKERKRVRLAQGQLDGPYTRQTPGWLRWSDETRAYELIPERAEIVRSIFARADEGWGLDRIARDLNRREVETWGEGKRKSAYWRGSYVRKIVSSKAPIGLFTPVRSTRDEDSRARRDVPFDPVPLFPAAVDEDVYWRVVRRFQTTAPRGRNAFIEPASIVAGVAKCCTCGGSMIRVSKGRSKGKLYVYLLCSKAHEKAKGCEYLPVRYEDVVEALTVNVEALVLHAPGGKDTTDIEAEIRNLQAYADVIDSEVGDLADLAAGERTPAATKRFRERERELERRRKELRELRARKATLTPASVSARLEVLRAALTREPLDVVEVNTALRQAVSRIVVDPKQATLSLHWHHTDEVEHVPFYARHKVWETGAYGYSATRIGSPSWAHRAPMAQTAPCEPNRLSGVIAFLAGLVGHVVAGCASEFGASSRFLGRVLINVAATTAAQGPLLERSGHEPQGKTGRIGRK
jgi:hypothetical protein